MSRSSKPKDAFRVAKATKRLRGFASDLEAAIQRCLPSRTGYYDQVSVIAMHWENDDLGVLPLEKALLDIFKNQYGYDVESFEIPEDRPQKNLTEKLVSWTSKHEGEQALRIVIYSGHASAAGPTDLHWYFAGQVDNSGNLTGPSLDWNGMKAICEYGTGDLCYIFDCCSAGSGPGALYDGAEMLCASVFEQTAGADPKFSFTQALIDTLDDLKGAPCTIANLFAILYRNSSQHEVAASPLHIAKRNSPSIVLEKLVTETVPNPMTKTALGDTKESKPKSQKKHKVLLAVHIADDNPSLAAWKQWLLSRNIPPGVLSAEITVEAVYETEPCSSLLLVTIPLEIWTVLDPTDEAFSFISFVNSSGRTGGQLLQEVQP
ncbi:uncharacterized protein DSM5745_07209 [Aspergillus mulundensis]|uniref:Uncharacterized protein n=1 Tax=Aspergillus mulundensis TaxID=1810919 RepID=A0A3D8RKG9_9EURO|nr:Uncharacterized protein DSM5745_07209 [Aspergillus mulundensis]RDW74547.1 Uncharacterized protein DSM5745_07209 [Aspergillus mulundensis]